MRRTPLFYVTILATLCIKWLICFNISSETNYLRMYSTDLLQVFRIDRHIGVDDQSMSCDHSWDVSTVADIKRPIFSDSVATVIRIPGYCVTVTRLCLLCVLACYNSLCDDVSLLQAGYLSIHKTRTLSDVRVDTCCTDATCISSVIASRVTRNNNCDDSHVLVICSRLPCSLYLDVTYPM